jgi:addiction module HigA family antidote
MQTVWWIGRVPTYPVVPDVEAIASGPRLPGHLRMERQVRTVTGQRRAPVRERYEYAPDSYLPPGDTLRETLEALPMSQAELSTRTGLSTKHINQIVQGVAVLSHDTAIALERATGVPACLWNSLEANYRDYLARKREQDELTDQTA